MSDVEEVTIALPPPMAKAMTAAIEAGEFLSPGEVVRDALRLWLHERQLRSAELQRAKEGDEERGKYSRRRDR